MAETGELFQTEGGVRQGCPLSPYLFIIVLELMAIAMHESSEVEGIAMSENGEDAGHKNEAAAPRYRRGTSRDRRGTSRDRRGTSRELQRRGTSREWRKTPAQQPTSTASINTASISAINTHSHDRKQQDRKDDCPSLLADDSSTFIART